MSNSKLNRAQQDKNDEFYTLLTELSLEMENFPSLVKILKEKGAQLPCDSKESAFTVWAEKEGIKIERSDGDIIADIHKESEKIVFTNPPFSILQFIVTVLLNKERKFFILAPINYLGTLQCFVLVRDKKLKVLDSTLKNFDTPCGDIKQVGTVWITNLDIDKVEEELKVEELKVEDGTGIPIMNMNQFSILGEKVTEVYVPVTYLYDKTINNHMKEWDMERSPRVVSGGKQQFTKIKLTRKEH